VHPSFGKSTLAIEYPSSWQRNWRSRLDIAGIAIDGEPWHVRSLIKPAHALPALAPRSCCCSNSAIAISRWDRTVEPCRCLRTVRAQHQSNFARAFGTRTITT